MANSNSESDKDVYSIEATVETCPEAVRGRERSPFKSFRHRDYRYFWSGALISNTGTWMQTVAVGWVVYDITKAGNPSAALGVINFLNFLPTTLLTLFAGLFADRLNRKRLIIVAQTLLMIQALLLARLTQVNAITIVLIGGLVLFGGVITAFVFPAWQAMLPDIVPKKLLLNAVALNAAQFNGARLLGPLLGGLVFARYGAAEVFYVNAISFLFVIAALALIHPRQEQHARSCGGALSTLTAGLKYTRENRQVAWLLISVLMLSLYGMPYITLMPVIAAQVLGQGATGYAVLMGASGLGAVIGALFVASLPPHVRRGLLIRAAVLGMGAALLAFSLSRNYYLSVGLVSLAGASLLTGSATAMTGVQWAAPPRLRGRVMALFVLCFMGMQPFSSLGFGWLGGVIGPDSAVLAGAAVLLAYAFFLFLQPDLLAEPLKEREAS